VPFLPKRGRRGDMNELLNNNIPIWAVVVIVIAAVLTVVILIGEWMYWEKVKRDPIVWITENVYAIGVIAAMALLIGVIASLVSLIASTDHVVVRLPQEALFPAGIVSVLLALCVGWVTIKTDSNSDKKPEEPRIRDLLIVLLITIIFTTLMSLIGDVRTWCVPEICLCTLAAQFLDIVRIYWQRSDNRIYSLSS